MRDMLTFTSFTSADYDLLKTVIIFNIKVNRRRGPFQLRFLTEDFSYVILMMVRRVVAVKP